MYTTMGRFRLVSLHDDSDDEVEEEEEQPAPQHWEFVGEPGEEGALVVREDEDPCRTTTAPSTDVDDQTRTARRRADEFWGRIRPPQHRRPSPDDEWETDVSCPNDDG